MQGTLIWSVNSSIIFIHGINSTPGQCWSKKSTGGRIVLWPRDLLPNAIKHARIATFGYNSSVINEASSARIRDHAMNLFQDLIDLRKDEPVCLVFVYSPAMLSG